MDSGEICLKCGTLNEQGARYCRECRNSLGHTGSTVRFNPSPSSPLVPDPQHRSRLLPLLGVLAAIILLGLGWVIGRGTSNTNTRLTPIATVALVAEATTVPTAPTVWLVPKVIGLDQAAAERLVAGIGLQPVKNVAFDDTVRQGAVISQDPPADAQVNMCEGQVVLVISQGPLPQPTQAPATDTPIPTVTPNPTATQVQPSPTQAPEILYQAGGAAGWDGWEGRGWQAAGEMLLATGTLDQPSVAWAPVDLGATADYAVEAEIQFVREAGGAFYPFFGIVARSNGINEGYLAAVCTRGNCLGTLLLPRVDNDFPEDVIAGGPVQLDNQWHTYRFEVKGNTLRFFMDGGLQFETTNNLYLSSGKVGLHTLSEELNVRSFRVIKQ